MTPNALMIEARAAKAAGRRLVLEFPQCFKRPKGFPRGELLCVNCDGRQVRSFNPDRFIKFLASRTWD